MTSHVVSALVEKRAELAGQIEAAERRLRAMREDLAHVDATLRLFDPAIRPERIRSKRPPTSLPVIMDLYRHVLDVLRDAAEAMSSREIAREVIQRTGASGSALEAVDKAASAYLRRQEGRLVERTDMGRPARWRVRD